MQPRLDYSKASPDAVKAMLGLEGAIARGSIERPLIELVKMRASQINGCAYCLDMHSKDARAAEAGGRRDTGSTGRDTCGTSADFTSPARARAFLLRARNQLAALLGEGPDRGLDARRFCVSQLPAKG